MKLKLEENKNNNSEIINNIEKDMLDFYDKVLIRSSQIEREKFQINMQYIAEEINKTISILDKKNDSTLLNPLCSSVNEKTAGIKVLAEELMEPFLLFIVGMGKYGKSTLVNSLITKEVADIDFLPKTWKIDIYKKAKKDREPAQIRFNDDSLEAFDVDKAKDMIEKEEEKKEESEELIEEKFKKISERLETIEAKEEAKQKLANKYLYKSPITESYWPCDVGEASLLNDFNIVDTPGLNQYRNGKKSSNDLRDYYHKADGVIWILDANTLASAEANKSINELEKNIELIGGEVDNVIAVLNRIDLVRNRGGKRDIERVYQKAEEIYGDIFLDIVPISAQEGIDAINNSSQDKYKKSGIPALRSAVDKYFLRNSFKMKSKSKIRGLKGYLRDIETEIDKYLERLKKDNHKRLNLKKDLNKDIHRVRKRVEKEIDFHLDKYHSQVKANIELKAEQLFDIDAENKSELKKFLKNQIYEEEALEIRVEKMQLKYKKILKDAEKDIKEKSLFKEFKHIDQKTSLILSDANSKINHLLDFGYDELSDSSFFGNVFSIIAGGLLLGPVGVIIGILASSFNIFGGIVKFFKIDSIKEKLENELDMTVFKVRQEVIKKVESDLEVLKDSAAEIRRESFEALHVKTSSVEETIEKLNQIKKIDVDALKNKYNIIELFS